MIPKLSIFLLLACMIKAVQLGRTVQKKSDAHFGWPNQQNGDHSNTKRNFPRVITWNELQGHYHPGYTTPEQAQQVILSKISPFVEVPTVAANLEHENGRSTDPPQPVAVLPSPPFASSRPPSFHHSRYRGGNECTVSLQGSPVSCYLYTANYAAKVEELRKIMMESGFLLPTETYNTCRRVFDTNQGKKKRKKRAVHFPSKLYFIDTFVNGRGGRKINDTNGVPQSAQGASSFQGSQRREAPFDDGNFYGPSSQASLANGNHNQITKELLLKDLELHNQQRLEEKCLAADYKLRKAYYLYNVFQELRFIVQIEGILEQCQLEAVCR